MEKSSPKCHIFLQKNKQNLYSVFGKHEQKPKARKQDRLASVCLNAFIYLCSHAYTQSPQFRLECFITCAVIEYLSRIIVHPSFGIADILFGNIRKVRSLWVSAPYHAVLYFVRPPLMAAVGMCVIYLCALSFRNFCSALSYRSSFFNVGSSSNVASAAINCDFSNASFILSMSLTSKTAHPVKSAPCLFNISCSCPCSRRRSAPSCDRHHKNDRPQMNTFHGCRA